MAGAYGRVTVWDVTTAKPVRVLTNVLAAVNDGMRKARDMVAAEMSKVTGGFKIPGLMP